MHCWRAENSHTECHFNATIAAFINIQLNLRPLLNNMKSLQKRKHPFAASVRLVQYLFVVYFQIADIRDPQPHTLVLISAVRVLRQM